MNYILHRLIASHIKLAEPPTTRSPVATVKLECAYTNRHAIHAHVSGFLALYCAAINVYSFMISTYKGEMQIMLLMIFLLHVYCLPEFDRFLIKINLE